MILITILALVGLTFAACPKDPIEEILPPGEETGTYYYEEGDEEYLIILNDGNKFAFDVEGKNKSGTYIIDENGVITLTFNKEKDQEQPEVLSATLIDTYIELTYNGKDYRFLKKVYFSVSFDVGAGSQIETVKVLNGKTVGKPDTPTLLGHYFMSWYSDENYTTPFAFNTQRIYSDTTIYARWVVDDPTVPEYLVEFDINMEGENPEPRQTIGGRLYDLSTPSRSGYEFKGWWVSMYDDDEKLSYKYEEDMVLNENTTLYAYWQPIATGTKLPNAVIKLDKNQITWEGIVGANNYNLIIQKVIDERNNLFDEIHNVTTPTPSAEFDFSQYDAGDYRISVTAIAANPADNSVGTIYYKNKALARVSHFAVTEPSVLYFNSVEGATRYLISVDVGDEFINIVNFDNGNNAFFDFSSFPMPEDGIKFTFTAVAEGRASSTRTFVYNRMLSPVTNIYFNQETEILSWDRVPNATNYILSISSGNSTAEHEYIDVGNSTTYCLKDHAGQDGGIIINIYPKTKGWNSPAKTKYVYNKTRLAAPREIKVVGRTITWNKIPGATSYELELNNQTFTSENNSFVLPENFAIVEGVAYTLNIRALGDNPSIWSDGFVMHGNMSNLRYLNNTAYWDYVVGAVGYEVYVNGELQNIVEGGLNQSTVELTAGGKNVISARAIFSDGSYSGSISIQIYAHTIRFEANGGQEIVERYFATGDKVEVPESIIEGYEFAGWYLGVEQTFGAPYTDTKYLHTGDITLYAAWLAKSYTVTFDYGNGAGRYVKLNSWNICIPTCTICYKSNYI